MKPDKLYAELKVAAEKLGIRVMEQNFRNVGIRVKSGHCVVKGENHCLINKHIKLRQKIEALSECLAAFPQDAIYMLPAVREHLALYTPQESDGQVGAEIAEIQDNK